MVLTYSQWFVLLVIKNFPGTKPDGVVRWNSLEVLRRRRLCRRLKSGGYSITDKGVQRLAWRGVTRP